MKINEIHPSDHEFLQILGNLSGAPSELYYRGSLPTKRQPSVAIVGTRKPTSYGQEVTKQLATELAQRGVIIISGLALGVDGIAHKAALDAGGITLAVLGNGLSYTYPKAHHSLGEEIITGGGALLSEYEPDTQARPHYFLARNRIVSGLADAIIITEAAARSGTLNTAAHALEQGKDVFVVPGNITSPMSAGCNQLLKQGATPLTSSDDVLAVVAPDLIEKASVLPTGSTQLEQRVIELLASGISDGDELHKRSGATRSELSSALTMLEINGAIRSLGADQWTLR